MIIDLKKNPQTNPYPHKFNVKFTIPKFIQTYDYVEKEKWV